MSLRVKFLALSTCILLTACQTRVEKKQDSDQNLVFSKSDIPFSLSFQWNETNHRDSLKYEPKEDLASTVVASTCFVHEVSPSNNVLMSCVDRKVHSHFELYALSLDKDLPTLRETHSAEASNSTGPKKQRLTFQDKNIISARWLAGDKVIYSSATDEFKESDEHYIQYLKDKYLSPENANGKKIHGDSAINDNRSASEIYQYNLNNKSNRRLTWINGYNDIAGINLKSNEPLITTLQKKANTETTVVQSLSQQLKLQNQWTVDKPVFQVAVHQNQQHATWISWDKKSEHTTVKIYDIANNATTELTLPKGKYWFPRWHPTKPWITFSGQNEDAPFFEIYFANVAGDCVEKAEIIGTQPDDAFAPAFGPKGDSMYFSKWSRNQLEVLQMPFAPTSTCFNEDASIN